MAGKLLLNNHPFVEQGYDCSKYVQDYIIKLMKYKKSKLQW